MVIRLTWTDYDKAGDYVVPNELNPRNLVSRPDNMDETTHYTQFAPSTVSLTVHRANGDGNDCHHYGPG